MKKKPRILIVYKRSSLSVAGRLSEQLRRAPRFEANHRIHYETLKTVERDLHAMGLPYHKYARNLQTNYSPYDLVITVGGDGTVLGAARNLNNRQLLLGVNSDRSWSVGQFCHAHSGNFARVMRQLLAGQARVTHLHKLRVVLHSDQSTRTIECLNDILICHANPAAMSRYQITIGGVTEEHRNSGIWFASAAGSTGAILSAGGRKMEETRRDIQYQPRELYHVKGVKYRLQGGLFSLGKTASIVSQMPHGRIFADGAHVKFPLTYGHKAIISSSPHYVRLVHG